MADNTVIIGVKLNVSDSIQQMEQLKREIKEQQDLMKTYGKDTEEFKNAANKIYGMKEQLKILNTTTTQAVREQTANATSMKALGLELGRNKERYRNLTEEERNNAAIGGKLLATIQAQDAKIKQLDSTLGNHQRNVGNYKEALQGVGTSFGKIFSAAGLAQMAVQGITKVFGFMKDNIRNIISSVQSVGDAFAANMGGASEATNYLFMSIANLDFSNLITGLDEAFKAGKKYTEMLDLIGDMQRALGVEKKTIEGQIIEQEIIAKNRALDLKDREAAIDKIVELEQEKLKKTKIITSAALQNELDLAKSRSKLNDDALKQIFGSIKNQQLLAKGQELWVKLMKESKLAEQSLNDERALSVQLGGDYEESSKKKQTANEIYLKSLSKLTSEERQAVYFAEQTFKIDDTLRGKITTAMEKDIQANNDYNNGLMGTVMMRNKLMKQFLKEENEDIKAAEQRKKKLDELEKLRIELIQDAQEKEIALENKRYDDYVKQWGELEGAYQLHVNKLLAIDKSYNDLKKVEIIKNKEVQQQAFLETSTALTDAYEAQREAEIKSEEELSQRKIEIAKNEAEFKKSIASSVNSIVTTLMDIELIKAGENEEKKKQIRKKYANIQAATSAAMTIVNTAEGITKALAELGPIAGVIASALVGATGLVELGVINAQRQAIQGLATGTPEVTKGGVFKVGEKGPEQVYLPTGAAVIPNSLIDFAPFTAAMPSQTGMAEMIINGIKNIRTVVTVEDINAAQLSEANRVKIGKI